MIIPEKPEFDYPHWSYQSREGIQSAGNYKYMTDSLFIERAPDPKTALYTMDEHERYVPELGKWLPSAWLIYIHATDEYDALRKLVGNVRHWETLKVVPWFASKLEQWQAEHAYLQRSLIRDALMSKLQFKGDVAAGRTLLQMIDNTLGAKGRPKKEKPDNGPSAADLAADGERVAHLFGKK